MEDYEKGLQEYAGSPLCDKGVLQLLRRKVMPEKLAKALQRVSEKIAYLQSMVLPTLPVEEALPLPAEAEGESLYDRLQNVSNAIVDSVFDADGRQVILNTEIEAKVGNLVGKAVELAKQIEMRPKSRGELERDRNNLRANITKEAGKIKDIEADANPDLGKLSERKKKLAMWQIELKGIDLQIEAIKHSDN
jgi:hypothetical protein